MVVFILRSVFDFRSSYVQSFYVASFDIASYHPPSPKFFFINEQKLLPRAAERPKRRFRRTCEVGSRAETAPSVRADVIGSEEYDTWSEPDVGASRTRMGLSRHVLDLIEKTGHSMRPEEEDSSEVEKTRKEKRELPDLWHHFLGKFSHLNKALSLGQSLDYLSWMRHCKQLLPLDQQPSVL